MTQKELSNDRMASIRHALALFTCMYKRAKQIFKGKYLSRLVQCDKVKADDRTETQTIINRLHILYFVDILS